MPPSVFDAGGNRPLRPGQRLTATEQNALVRGLAEGDRASGTGDAGVARGLGGVQVRDFAQPGLWARITGAPTGDRYPWVEVFDRLGTWTDIPRTAGGREGSAAYLPAREVNGRTDVAADTLVWLVPEDTADPPGYSFAAGSGSGGGDWFYAELYDVQAVSATPGAGEVNADALGYKLVRRKLVGSGKWADDGDPFDEFNAFCAEPLDGFAGRFRVRYNSSAAGEPAGRGLLVLARSSPDEPGSYEFTPVVPEWNLWVVTARTARTGPPNNLTPPLYTVRLTELIRDLDTGTAGNQEGWREVSPAVELSGCVRAPMAVYDESRTSELRPPIEVGAVVQVRPSPTNAGRYELFGASVNKVRVKAVVATCSQCHDPGSGVRVIRTKNALRTLTIAGSDFVVYWEPGGTAESGVRDNTAGAYQPPFDVGT